MSTIAPPIPRNCVTATPHAFLKHAIGVYAAAIEGDWHTQSKDFHRVVLNDAKLVMGDRTVTPSWHVKNVREACREVCDELSIICLSRKGNRISGLAARKRAAELLGIDYKTFKKVLKNA